MKSFLDQSAGYLNHIVGLLLKREILEAIKKNKINITPEQWAILNRLNEHQGLTQNELAKISFKDTANITRMIDKLEDKGFVERRANPSDRRIWKIYITDQGRKGRDLIEPLAKEVLRKATKNIDSKEVELYNDIAKRIIANLER
ncbi:MAG: MarR family transcriptional regulator [Reichenbachiella sp.]|uniref:MarR family winged helix-turn-helix transcriptional regulator n=1 Tax=Reichenbachiella sp. TaxID=2184521 RepID=UPI003265DEE3